ncbi:hypothetical protein FO440_09920 [Mucilaginibacter corticis]|uniref:Uncharacterized protein n=1 Tax=Mucilaginibacter corticis TaxID=2597670 RepID=A0A556MX65_9SPHI|nr:hypothetical protein [Mucilaginibacter corticis]TSJ44472.1 hypothetical protein FO440_09920 [Mucilaginibacter corticis]
MGNATCAFRGRRSWITNVDQAWESGGPGRQKITVIYTDPANHTICLRRDGDSEGFYENERPELNISKDGKPLSVKINPGKTHWTGFTIFRDGLIISDELVAERPMTLTAADGTVYKRAAA